MGRSQDPVPSRAAPPPVSPSRLEQLKTLGELRDSGVLTPEEFETEKALVMGTMQAMVGDNSQNAPATGPIRADEAIEFESSHNPAQYLDDSLSLAPTHDAPSTASVPHVERDNDALDGNDADDRGIESAPEPIPEGSTVSESSNSKKSKLKRFGKAYATAGISEVVRAKKKQQKDSD